MRHRRPGCGKQRAGFDCGQRLEWGGYGLYSEGDIVIRGENTEIDSDDAFGIEAGGILYIEGGQVRVASTDTALLGWNGVVITGGTIDATSEIGSAIIGRDGPVSITGAGTSVTATAKGDDAAIRNANDGGIFLAAPVTAVNTQGGKPFLGVNADKSVAITLGEGFDLFGAEVYTDATGAQSQSYFIPAGGSADEPPDLRRAVQACVEQPRMDLDRELL